MLGSDSMPPASAVLPTLRQLQSVFVSLECLQETRVGEVVYRLRRHSNEEVRGLADALYARWRADAQEAIKRGLKKAASGPAAVGSKRGATARPAPDSADAASSGGGGGGVSSGAAFLYTASHVADLVDELEGWEADAAKRYKAASSGGGGGGVGDAGMSGGGARLVMARVDTPAADVPAPGTGRPAAASVGSKRASSDAAASWRGGLGPPPPPPAPLQWRPTVAPGR